MINREGLKMSDLKVLIFKCRVCGFRFAKDEAFCKKGVGCVCIGCLQSQNKGQICDKKVNTS